MLIVIRTDILIRTKAKKRKLFPNGQIWSRCSKIRSSTSQWIGGFTRWTNIWVMISTF